jgi:hypothetical protein
MHLIGYLYEDYHDARSLEHKVLEKLIGYVYVKRKCCLHT